MKKKLMTLTILSALTACGGGGGEMILLPQ